MADRYAGIDWTADKHDVLVAEETGTEVLAGTYAHDENELSALCRMLVRLEVVLVAIERPDGVLVERLLDAGLQVLPLDPNKVAAARDRFRVARGKSDRFDRAEIMTAPHHIRSRRTIHQAAASGPTRKPALAGCRRGPDERFLGKRSSA